MIDKTSKPMGETMTKKLPYISFESEADLFLAQYEAREINGTQLGNENTHKQYKRGLTRLMEFMLANDVKNINEMRLPLLNKLQNEMLEMYAPKTTQTYLGVIKEFFYFLQSRGQLASNDFSSLKIVTVDKRDQKTPSLTEAMAMDLMAHVMSQENSPYNLVDKIMMITLMNTGIREEELTKIKIGDIVKQGDNLVITINGKGMRKRFVVMSPEASLKLMHFRDMLEVLVGMPLDSDDYLIQPLNKNRKGKALKPISAQAIIDRINAISEASGVYFTAHAIRRTFATLHYKKGTPLEVIQRMMGHESPTTTQGYISMEIDKDVSIKHAISMVG